MATTRGYVPRRPSGWYAQLYRRTYGERAPATKAGTPGLIWVGLALVVAGIFTPWVRGAGGWISALTALDVPVRWTWDWYGNPATGTGSGFLNGVTGLSVGFCAAVLAVSPAGSAPRPRSGSWPCPPRWQPSSPAMPPTPARASCPSSARACS